METSRRTKSHEYILTLVQLPNIYININFTSFFEIFFFDNQWVITTRYINLFFYYKKKYKYKYIYIYIYIYTIIFFILLI